MTFLENALHYDDYFHLRQSVNWNNFSEQQTVFALNHTLYSIIAKSEQETIAMGRLIGDGLYYTIVDVIVNPAFQGQGIGSAVIHKLLNYVEKNTPPGGRSSVSLIAEKGKEAFYETLGFKKIPHEFCGSGILNVIQKKEINLKILETGIIIPPPPPKKKSSIHQIIRAILEPNGKKRPRKCPFYQHFRGSVRYSNSIVAGGFPVQSYNTLFTPFTSFTILLVTFPSTSQGI